MITGAAGKSMDLFFALDDQLQLTILMIMGSTNKMITGAAAGKSAVLVFNEGR